MVLERVKEILSEQFNIEEDSINCETKFVNDLNADSLDIADLLSTISGEFEVDIESEPVENFNTVGDVVEFIRQKKHIEEDDIDI